MKKLLIAVGVVIVALGFKSAPFYDEWLGWILFIVLLLLLKVGYTSVPLTTHYTV